jgi:ParB family transcriptional regulator, chromosome partitioning protein
MCDNLQTLSLNEIFPNPNQPRKEFDQEKLEELAMSIRQYGVLEPIVVTPRDDHFMIIAGERRYRASLLAGIKEIPARVIEADDALVEELALLENIQRQDLNIIEEAKAFQALLDRGWSREDLARKMGFKQAWRVDERTSLLNLTPEYQGMVANGAIGNSQAFEMSRVPAAQQSIIFGKIQSGDLNTYNKLRSFVDGLIMASKQENIFSFETITQEERKTVNDLDNLFHNIERFIKDLDAEGLKGIKKATFHSGITPERIDVIVHHLMKYRKLIQAGAGMKTALEL